ncbi:hypothetical protein, partial [Paenibacillus taichungensis]|uniref:hypothetical protein n=1 Tax=Paenibacillus taichungensis TaxID=484184 RepID=UPI001C52BA40
APPCGATGARAAKRSSCPSGRSPAAQSSGVRRPMAYGQRERRTKTRAHARTNHSKIIPATPAPLVWRVSRGPAKVLWGPPGREDLGGAKKKERIPLVRSIQKRRRRYRGRQRSG